MNIKDQTNSIKSNKSDKLYSQSEMDEFLADDQISKKDLIFFKQLIATEIVQR